MSTAALIVLTVLGAIAATAMAKLRPALPGHPAMRTDPEHPLTPTPCSRGVDGYAHTQPLLRLEPDDHGADRLAQALGAAEPGPR